MSTPIKIRIGNHTVTLTVEQWERHTPDLLRLLQMATTIEIVVPERPDAAEVLGRLVFCSSQAQPQDQVVKTDLISLLSRRIDQLDGLSTWAQNRCTEADLVYVWQIVQMTEVDLMKIRKGFGKKTIPNIIGALERIGLRLNMNIRELKDQLPKP